MALFLSGHQRPRRRRAATRTLLLLLLALVLVVLGGRMLQDQSVSGWQAGSQAAPRQGGSSDLQRQVEQLRREKAALEAQLAELRQGSGGAGASAAQVRCGRCCSWYCEGGPRSLWPGCPRACGCAPPCRRPMVHQQRYLPLPRGPAADTCWIQLMSAGCWGPTALKSGCQLRCTTGEGLVLAGGVCRLCPLRC